MKNTIKTFIAFIFMTSVISCSNSDSLVEKQKQLEALKSQQQDLSSKIAELQAEIELIDTITKQDNRAKLVAIAKVNQQVFEHKIEVQGQVDGEENVTYSAKVPAIVSSIPVKTGQRVGRGDVLAILDNKAAKSQLETLRKSFELANTVYEKQKQLWEQQVGSEIQFLQSKNNKETLEKQIAAVSENVELYTIRSDFDGVVDMVNVKVGQNVAPGMPCIKVVNNKKLKIKTDISESYSSRIHLNDEVTIVFPDLGSQLMSHVSHVSQTIDMMTRTFRVEIELPANNQQLRPNMVAQVGIVDYFKKDAIVVPVNAIQRIDGEEFVFVAEQLDGKWIAKKKVVKSGLVYKGQTEILSGLLAGESLITVGFQDLTDNQSIKL